VAEPVGENEQIVERLNCTAGAVGEADLHPDRGWRSAEERSLRCETAASAAKAQIAAIDAGRDVVAADSVSVTPSS
jgi:hypothetical protein